MIEGVWERQKSCWREGVLGWVRIDYRMPDSERGEGEERRGRCYYWGVGGRECILSIVVVVVVDVGRLGWSMN